MANRPLLAAIVVAVVFAAMGTVLWLASECCGYAGVLSISLLYLVGLLYVGFKYG